MSVNESLTVQQPENTEVSLPCQTCHGKTAHGVLAEALVRRSEEHGDYSYDSSADYQITKCLGCKSITFRMVTSNSEDYDIDDRGQICYGETEVFYPPRAEGRKGIGDGVWLLPIPIKRIYDETLQVLVSGAAVLAGVGLRALLEAVCKEKSANGRDLYQKIDDLRAKGVLTPSGAEILHKIRTLGNAAAHEIKPHSEKQLALAMDVVEHLLMDVYILPARAHLEFSGD